MGRILYLSVKTKWFEMICSGEKTEEYREIKPYWMKRFGLVKVRRKGNKTDIEKLEGYTRISFTRGYSPLPCDNIIKEFVSITKGYPKKGLCPDEMLGKLCYVIKFK